MRSSMYYMAPVYLNEFKDIIQIVPDVLLHCGYYKTKLLEQEL